MSEWPWLNCQECNYFQKSHFIWHNSSRLKVICHSATQGCTMKCKLLWCTRQSIVCGWMLRMRSEVAQPEEMNWLFEEVPAVPPEYDIGPLLTDVSFLPLKFAMFKYHCYLNAGYFVRNVNQTWSSSASDNSFHHKLCWCLWLNSFRCRSLAGGREVDLYLKLLILGHILSHTALIASMKVFCYRVCACVRCAGLFVCPMITHVHP